MISSQKPSGITASQVLAVPFMVLAFAFGFAGCGSGTADGADSGSPSGSTEVSEWGPVQTHAGEAQGTTYSIKYLSESRLEDSVFEDLLKTVDQEVSLWLPGSQINAINQWGRTDSLYGFVDSDQIIGPLWALSEELNELTRGAFDPTVSPLVELWGFGLSKRGEVTQEAVDSVLAYTGLRPERFDMNEEESNGMCQRTWVRKGHPNAALDFNAIAQGYTVDLLLEELRLRGVMNAMVELGGEVVCRGVNASGNPWRIAVDRPLAGTGASDRVLETVVSVKDRAICTSGNYRKFYEQGGRRYSHTIDPATGYPAENGLLSATVLAPSAAYADALATAFMVLGAEQTRGFLATYPGLGLDVLLMSDDGEGGYTLWETPGFKAVSSPL